MRFVLRRFLSLGFMSIFLISLSIAQAEPSASVHSSSVNSLNSERVDYLEKLYVRQGPSIGLKAVYNSLPPEERLGLIKVLQHKLQGLIDSGALNHPALEQLPPELALMVKNAALFAQATDPVVIDNIVKNTDLDHLMPLPPVVVRAYADSEGNKVIPGTTMKRSELMAQDRAASSEWIHKVLATDGYTNAEDLRMNHLELLSYDSDVSDDEIAKDRVKPTKISPKLVKQTLVADLPPLTMANSSRLARALNHLTNPSYQDNPMTADLFGNIVEVHSGAELLDSLLGTGLYTPVVYDGRMFVNFVGISVKHGDSIIPVKVPTWVATGIDPLNPEVVNETTQNSGEATGSIGAEVFSGRDGKSLIVPVNHSEHILVLFKKGTSEPAMLVRWYMGLPGKELAQGTIFKAAIFQRPSWSSYRIVNSYEGSAAVNSFITGGSRIMQLYNFIQRKYQYRTNGYAVLAVCQDTTGLMEGILKGDGKEVTIWPLSRDPHLDFYYESIATEIGLKLHSAEGKGLILDVPTDSHPDLYPHTKERQTALTRIGLNIPTRNVEELHFPALKTAVSIMAEKSPHFREALAK